jgi:hypothetical protein
MNYNQYRFVSLSADFSYDVIEFAFRKFYLVAPASQYTSAGFRSEVTDLLNLLQVGPAVELQVDPLFDQAGGLPVDHLVERIRPSSGGSGDYDLEVVNFKTEPIDEGWN